MMTASDIARKLKCSVGIIYRLINQGIIQAIDISPGDSLRKTYRIASSDFREFVKNQTIKPLSTRRRRRRKPEMELLI